MSACIDSWWRHFKIFLKALNGTYNNLNVVAADRPRYRTWKGKVATNFLDVCDTKGNFVFVLSGWKDPQLTRASFEMLFHDPID
ncbi:retrotransposon protein [Cucumis melo var. makuwa]|uniref:Retrotransposon protein n=1 Tax=Cucumis melo var. makuwa TaxID=1194695 RepID=A0A5A7T1P8_CUCMM|nr:retrotransposon protein [Cucumis melo var. makuwa]TYJ97538.1 retrotransposon protein [Cucumis melo var. makuwa]